MGEQVKTIGKRGMSVRNAQKLMKFNELFKLVLFIEDVGTHSDRVALDDNVHTIDEF